MVYTVKPIKTDREVENKRLVRVIIRIFLLYSLPSSSSSALHKIIRRAVSNSVIRDMLKIVFKDRFFYQLYFQTPGVAEAELEADVRTALRKFYHMASGQMDIGSMPDKPADADLLSDLPDPEQLGAWMSDADLDFYVSEFSRSGFRGPLNYYRNHNLTWELTAGAPTQIQQPALFVAGDRDGVITMAAQALEAMPNYVTDLRVNALIPGVGHWTQQEAAEATNEYLLDWLASLD